MVPEEAAKHQFALILRGAAVLPAVLGASLAAPPAAHACAVCYGDPESPLTRGVAAGILVLLGFIGFVLTGIVSITGVWIVRARRLRRAARAVGRED